MRMNNVEMNDEMLEQVNAGSDIWTTTYEFMEEAFNDERNRNRLEDLWDKTKDKVSDTVSDVWNETKSTVECTVEIFENWLGL